jgi:streptogramin lyase
MMSDPENNPKLMRIALADNTVTAIPLGHVSGEYHRTTIGEGAVWATEYTGQTIYKIDPNTNLIVMTISADFPEIGNAPPEIGVGEGSVWAITGSVSNPVLRRYSAQTGAEQATIQLPSSNARGVVVDFGSIWIGGSSEVELYRIDPVTNQIIASIDLHSRPISLTSGEGSVWVREVDGTVQRFDGSSGKLLATVATEADGKYGDIAVGGGSVWINSLKVALIQIDPHTNSQRSRFVPPQNAFMGFTIAYGGSSLWLGGSAVYRVKPPE